MTDTKRRPPARADRIPFSTLLIHLAARADAEREYQQWLANLARKGRVA